MSLCFQDAFVAKRSFTITEAEYIDHLIAHFRGVRHPQDSDRDAISVKKWDPFGASIREMALRTNYEPLQDTAPYQELFCSCLTGNLDQVRSSLKQLVEPLQIPLQPLATLAARKGHTEILKFCLDEGAIVDANLKRAVELASKKNPAMDNVLGDTKEKLSESSKNKKQTQMKRRRNEPWSPEQLEEWFGDLPW